MNPKERILTIRLLEKLITSPSLAEAFLQTKEETGNMGGKHGAC